MGTLGKRLDALEQIAEECRRREQWEFLRAKLVRRYAADGIALGVGEVDQKAERALVLAEHMAALAASGLTLPEIARRVAIERALDPDHVATCLADVRARYDRDG